MSAMASSSSSSSSSPPPPQETNDKTNRKGWSLEESSLSWLSLDGWDHPGNVLLISSIPLCAGACFGYMRNSKKLEILAGKGGDSIDKKALESLAERRRLGVRTAARALRLATLGTVGTFGMLGAVAFYASGYTSVDEAVSATKVWASSWRERFENWLGMEDRPSKTHPEVLATKHMNEEEELKYIYDKYIKEPEERQQDSPPNESK